MNIKNFPKKRLIFLLILVFELLSFFCYLFPDFEKIAFLVVFSVALFLCFKDLSLGLLLVFFELLIGSKGYLFYLDIGSLNVSIRLALWILVMSFWLVKLLNQAIKHKAQFKEVSSLDFLRSKYFKYFLFLFLFLLWGGLRGFLLGNNFGNLFFDANGWLFLLLIFPAYSEIRKKDDFAIFLRVGLVAVLWLSAKTFILLFLFSHNLYGITYEAYRWVRITGVGEITKIQGGFYRIFFQSHIFILIAYFIFLFQSLSIKKIKNFFATKISLIYFFILVLLSSVVVLSLSRSFWAAGVIAYAFFVFILFTKYNYKKVFQILFVSLLSGLLGLIFIIIIVKFPYPNPLGGFDPTKLIGERATQIKNEAAISSRWNLLPELLSKIKESPILGQGFGATVTYKSNDPRIVESSANGEYTTYAFEWGWLDIWLKLGFFGLIAYLLFLFKIIFDKIKSSDNWNLAMGLKFGLVLIMLVSIFTPYTNHPLGLGYIIYSVLFLEYLNRETKS